MASSNGAVTHTEPRTRLVFACAACFFLLTCSGRMGSSDSFTQLQASIRLVSTGWVAADDPNPVTYCWVRGPDGHFYQAHDPGNLVLFVPAALVGAALGGPDPFHQPPLPARVATAFTCAILGAGCVAVLYRLLRSVAPPRSAIVGASLAAVGTPLWVYTRCTMDVLGGCFGVSLTLWALLAHATGRTKGARVGALTGVAVLIAAWFRVSLLPFLAAPALVSLAMNEPVRKWRPALALSLTVAIGMLPVFAYNAARTGNPLRPATATDQYADQNGFDGRFAEGLYGLFVAPNHGLLVFAPWLALAVLPVGIRVQPRPVRVVAYGLLAGTAGYALMIAGLKQWAKVEWGPRYLVPVLPVFVLFATLTAGALWQTRWRPLVAVLAVLSVAVSLPSGIANYSYVLTQVPGTVDPLAPTPRQIIEAYRAVGIGLTGGELQMPAALDGDPERLAGRGFPDFWTARLIERGGLARAAGWFFATGLAVGFVLTARRIFTRSPRNRSIA